VSINERENLPEEVRQGVTYRNLDVRLRIANELIVTEEEPHTTKAAKQKAEELGLNLLGVRGSGIDGRITLKDVRGAATRVGWPKGTLQGPRSAITKRQRIAPQGPLPVYWSGSSFDSLSSSSSGSSFDSWSGSTQLQFETSGGSVGSSTILKRNPWGTLRFAPLWGWPSLVG
jgi:pyruvate/2-oxoglutarate dehydrogenase complex dihydrolipoamide acyltransferase (E2) component